MTTIVNPGLLRSVEFFQPWLQEMNRELGFDKGNVYPFHDIVAIGDDDYRITLAVPGFKESELNLELKDRELSVSGVHTETKKSDNERFLFRSIQSHNFQRSYKLPENVQVVGAELTDGMLQIRLHREVPEDQKPQRIAINGSNNAHVIEHDAPKSKA